MVGKLWVGTFLQEVLGWHHSWVCHNGSQFGPGNGFWLETWYLPLIWVTVFACLILCILTTSLYPSY